MNNKMKSIGIGLSIFLIPSLFIFNSCNKNQAIQNTTQQIPITKKTRSVPFSNLGVNLSSEIINISSNSNLQSILNTNFISSRVIQANIGQIGSAFTKITDLNSGKYVYSVPLVNSSGNAGNIIIFPFDESKNIYTVFISNVVTINGVTETYLQQLDSRDNLGGYLKTKTGVDKTLDWWKDCITSAYNELTSDLQGQIYYAINVPVCCAAFVLHCSLQMAPGGGLTQQQYHQILCDLHIINCDYDVQENSIMFVSISKN